MRTLISVLAASCLSTVMPADTINVPGDHPTIAAAISASANGDVINIDAGTYIEHSLNPGGKAITIQGTLGGDGTLVTTIDAQQGGGVFTLNSGEGNGTVIRDLVITGGTYGGIYCHGSGPTITNCTISNNTGRGGISCNSQGPTTTITDCLITNNSANGWGGGGVGSFTGATFNLTGCTISNNTGTAAERGGGGVLVGGFVCYITDCTISDNTSSLGGGVCVLGKTSNNYFNFGGVAITGSDITNNTANGKGGGVWVMTGAMADLNNCMISGNWGGAGGGVGANTSNPNEPIGTDLYVDHCTITDNSSGQGGGIYCSAGARPRITNSTITNNSGSRGGGVAFVELKVASPSENELMSCIISGNTAHQYGGGLFFSGGTNSNFRIEDNLVEGNTASSGGGIYCEASSWDGSAGQNSFYDMTVSGNTASADGGGVVVASGTTSFYNSDICSNTPNQVTGSMGGSGNTILDICELDGDHDGDTIVNDCDPDFPLSIPDSEVQVLAGDGDAGDRFGWSVSLSGDRMVVGASYHDVGGNSDQGSAYVYERNASGEWVQKAQLTAFDGAVGDRFGRSVSLSGDRLVVGAYGDSFGAGWGQGSAYVFEYNGTDWGMGQKLTANDGEAGDEFGFSVSISGDRVVVGASYDDVEGKSNQGSA